MSNPYESQTSVDEYLFFHYATFDEAAGDLPVPREAWGFPQLNSTLAKCTLKARASLKTTVKRLFGTARLLIREMLQPNLIWV
jgi:hypothetical protein